MLIKEYRIPLPMSVEEYRIAQLYMIQKKSRLDSTGEGSGVEFIKNEPYMNGPGGNGQYTKKIYHIGNHLPGWLKAIIPKSALRVEEEAWNAYPYTKMRTTCPFVEKFFVDVETHYLPDAGTQTCFESTTPIISEFYMLNIQTSLENVFNLSPAELRSREVDMIDPLGENVPDKDYSAEEDPLIYKSVKTGRGPFTSDWLTEYQNAEKPPGDVMCAYKLIKVEFRYWGMQSKIEHFIHCGLRHPMLMGHRQAWVWQDEWFGMTMADIRREEKETQRLLAKRMRQIEGQPTFNGYQEEESDQEGFASTKNRDSVVYISPDNSVSNLGTVSRETTRGSRLELISKMSFDGESVNPSSTVSIKVERFDLERSGMPPLGVERDVDYTDAPVSNRAGKQQQPPNRAVQKQISNTSECSAHGGRKASRPDILKEWHMCSIERTDSLSDDEFFDAHEELDFEDSSYPGSFGQTNLLTVGNIELSNSFKSLEMDTDSSRGSRESLESVDSSVLDEQEGLDEEKLAGRLLYKQKLCQKLSDSSTCSIPSCKITTLLLVIHGGSVLDTCQDENSRTMDLELLQHSFEVVLKAHYRAAVGRIAIRLVECPAICFKTVSLLSQLCPFSDVDSDDGNVNSVFSPISSSFPLSAVPLMVSTSQMYEDAVSTTIACTNAVYEEFLRSEEGYGFRGEVCLIGDCIGALLVYDALTSGMYLSPRSRCTSFVSNSNFQPAKSNESSSSNSVSANSDIEKQTGASANRKPRRTSSHIPPNKSNLETSKNLRLSLSSGNIRDNVNPETDDVIAREPEQESVLLSPRQKGISKLHHFSFEANSLSIESVDKWCKRPIQQVWISSLSDHDGDNDDDDNGDDDVNRGLKHQAFMGNDVSWMLLAVHVIVVVENCHRENKSRLQPDPPPLKPACGQFYNLFHPFDPSASRVEPLVLSQMASVNPVNVPRYQQFPLGDGQSYIISNTVAAYPELFQSPQIPRRNFSSAQCSRPGFMRHDSNISTTSLYSSDGAESMLEHDISQGGSTWWGNKRLDYVLYCPEGLQQFPTAVLSPLFHVSYWESCDVAAFVVRQVLHGNWDVIQTASPSKKCLAFSPSDPREKWMRRRTAIKIKNLTANHRANDSLVLEGLPQVISGRFMYGPLDMVSIGGEKVDVYIMAKPPSGEYELFETVVTASHGRLTYTVPDDKHLPVGIYPVKMVVRGDHTWVDSNLAVLSPQVEAVVFSIDGSFTASVSIRGKDPKVRPGAVDVVRHWQELGFLIIYVTSRPDFQKNKVMTWLAEHNFPFGLVNFGEGISKELQRHKTEFLYTLVREHRVVIHAAYGSVKDIPVYNAVGVPTQQMYIVGKQNTSRKYDKQAQVLREGYAAHLTKLSSSPASRLAVGNSRLIIRKACFGLPRRPVKGKNKLRRTTSDKPGEESNAENSSTSKGGFSYTTFRHVKGRRSPFAQDS